VLLKAQRRRRWWQAGLSAVFVTVHLSIIYQFPPGSLERLTSFTAVKPFQYRVLIPALVHYLHLVLPLPLKVLYGAFAAISVFLILVYFEQLLERLAGAE